jgi:hypothetical protein
MRRLKITLLGLVMGGISVLAVVGEIGIAWYPPVATLADGCQASLNPGDVRLCMGARVLASLGDRWSQDQWFACAQHFRKLHALEGIDVRYWSLLLSGAFTLASAFGFALALRFDRPPARVLRGRQLLTGATARRAFAQASKVESRMSGTGLELLPGLLVSRERETRHWLIWGSVGAGKTQTMLHLILAAIARGDGVLVLDVKGDMTAGLPGEPLLIAPQDRRSLVWDVASDCRTKQDARELAARLIPKSDDPIWSDAARDILVACVAALQATKAERWSWHDLHEAATSDARHAPSFRESVSSRCRSAAGEPGEPDHTECAGDVSGAHARRRGARRCVAGQWQWPLLGLPMAGAPASSPTRHPAA